VKKNRAKKEGKGGELRGQRGTDRWERSHLKNLREERPPGKKRETRGGGPP